MQIVRFKTRVTQRNLTTIKHEHNVQRIEQTLNKVKSRASPRHDVPESPIPLTNGTDSASDKAYLRFD